MKSFSVKVAGVFAVVAFAIAGTTSAQTVAELQAMIAQLQSQIAAASSSSTTPATSFTRDLTIGSTGADVTALQTWLESKGFLTIPAGVSKGYFGEMTRAALAKYQMSVGISPAAGYFGPTTRAKVAAEGGSTSTPTTGGSTTVTGGETSLEDEDLQAEDDAQEGEMKHVATLEFDVEDADAKVDRMDLEFVFTGDDTQADDEPWKVFETVTLMVDGEEIAEADLDNEDEWLRDDSPFVFRVTGIDYVAEEGETAEIEVYLTAMDNVDGADSNDASWTIAVDDDGLRATDGEGIQNYVGDDTDTVAFDVEVLGEGESLEIKSSSSDPDASTLLVDEDDNSDSHEVFIFKLEAEENDIELDTLELTVTTGTEVYNDVIEDVVIEIDGEAFDDFDVVDGNTTTADLTFDIDGDFTIDADESVEVVVMIEFRDTNNGTNYANSGETVEVTVTAVDGEGMDDGSDTATLSGAEHTLSTSPAVVDNFDWYADPAGTYVDFLFTVTAEEDDFSVLAADIVGTTSGTATLFAEVLSKKSGDADEVTPNVEYTVLEGDSATFRIRYEVDTPVNGENFEVIITSVAGQTVPDDVQADAPTVVVNLN